MTEPGAARKSADAYRTISEVAADLNLPQHVLRFWETRFPQVKPLKRAGGRRFYRPEDVDLLRAVKTLLYGDGYTIKGVQRILREQGPRAVAALAATPRRELAARTAMPNAPVPTIGVSADPPAAPAPVAAPDVDPAAIGVPVGAGEEDARLGAAARLRSVLADLDECARLLVSVRADFPRSTF